MNYTYSFTDQLPEKTKQRVEEAIFAWGREGVSSEEGIREICRVAQERLALGWSDDWVALSLNTDIQRITLDLGPREKVHSKAEQVLKVLNTLMGPLNRLQDELLENFCDVPFTGEVVCHYGGKLLDSAAKKIPMEGVHDVLDEWGISDDTATEGLKSLSNIPLLRPLGRMGRGLIEKVVAASVKHEFEVNIPAWSAKYGTRVLPESIKLVSNEVVRGVQAVTDNGTVLVHVDMVWQGSDGYRTTRALVTLAREIAAENGSQLMLVQSRFSNRQLLGFCERNFALLGKSESIFSATSKVPGEIQFLPPFESRLFTFVELLPGKGL